MQLSMAALSACTLQTPTTQVFVTDMDGLRAPDGGRIAKPFPEGNEATVLDLLSCDTTVHAMEAVRWRADHVTVAPVRGVKARRYIRGHNGSGYYHTVTGCVLRRD